MALSKSLALSENTAKHASLIRAGQDFDDTGGPDGPETIYAPLTGAVDEEYAQGYYGMSDLDRIRAGQAKRAMINPDWQLMGEGQNVLQGEGAAILEQGLNRGGLANLFRVKNNQ